MVDEDEVKNAKQTKKNATLLTFFVEGRKGKEGRKLGKQLSSKFEYKLKKS